MAKRIFESEKGADMLLNEFVRESGFKIGKFLNNTIYCWFLPECKVLNIEATYLLQKAEKDDLDQWTIKQSLSRGISWLAKYPVEDCRVLQDIILHFTCAPYKNVQKDPRNEYVKEMFDVVEDKIKNINPEYNTLHACLGNFGEDICEYWNYLWKDKVVYEVISSIVYLCNEQKPFKWYEAISMLKEIENVAKAKYGIK